MLEALADSETDYGGLYRLGKELKKLGENYRQIPMENGVKLDFGNNNCATVTYDPETKKYVFATHIGDACCETASYTLGRTANGFYSGGGAHTKATMNSNATPDNISEAIRLHFQCLTVLENPRKKIQFKDFKNN